MKTELINNIKNSMIPILDEESRSEYEVFEFGKYEGLVDGEWDVIPNEFYSQEEAIRHLNQYQEIRETS